jgi:hypothetical protein
MKFKYLEGWTPRSGGLNKWDARGDENRRFVLEDGRTGHLHVAHSTGGWNHAVIIGDDWVASNRSWGESRKDKAMSLAVNKFRDWVAKEEIK